MVYTYNSATCFLLCARKNPWGLLRTLSPPGFSVWTPAIQCSPLSLNLIISCYEITNLIYVGVTQIGLDLLISPRGSPLIVRGVVKSIVDRIGQVERARNVLVRWNLKVNIDTILCRKPKSQMKSCRPTDWSRPNDFTQKVIVNLQKGRGKYCGQDWSSGTT